MPIGRRGFMKGVVGAGAVGLSSAYAGQGPTKQGSPSLQALDRAATAPVLKRDRLKSPVIIESIRLLKRDSDYFVHVRAKDGAEGVSLTNPPREQYLDKILKQLVIPFFI